MLNLTCKLWNDEAGFVISSELILIGTICVLALIVGLSELSHGVVQELEDVGSAVGAVNQTYAFHGYTGKKGAMVGSGFHDGTDECDDECDIVCNNPPREEGPKKRHRNNY